MDERNIQGAGAGLRAGAWPQGRPCGTVGAHGCRSPGRPGPSTWWVLTMPCRPHMSWEGAQGRRGWWALRMAPHEPRPRSGQQSLPAKAQGSQGLSWPCAQDLRRCWCRGAGLGAQAWLGGRPAHSLSRQAPGCHWVTAGCWGLPVSPGAGGCRDGAVQVRRLEGSRRGAPGREARPAGEHWSAQRGG